MAVYGEEIQMVKELLTELGQSVTWYRNTNGSPADPTKPWKPSAATAVQVAVNIAFIPTNMLGYESLRALFGTVIPHGSIVGFMGQVSFTPTLKDTVLRGSEMLSIEAIDELSPNGEIVMYTVRFKR